MSGSSRPFRGCRCSLSQVQGRRWQLQGCPCLARPVPQRQDGWQQQCWDSHNRMALPAMPGAQWAGRHGTGHGSTASHVPHGSPAVPPCHSQPRGACGLRNRLLLW